MFPKQRLPLQGLLIPALVGTAMISLCANAYADLPDNDQGQHSSQSAVSSASGMKLSYMLNTRVTEEECTEGEAGAKPQKSVADTRKNVDSPSQKDAQKPSSVLMAALTKDTPPARTQLMSQATPATPPLPTKSSAPSAPQVWEISPADKTLNAAIAKWTSIAGWQLSWELPVDYAVDVKTTIPGTFEEAVEMVTNSMDTAEIPMKAIFYNGNKVLRIVQKGAK